MTTTKPTPMTSEFQMLINELREISLLTQDISISMKSRLSEFSNQMITDKPILLKGVDEFDNGIIPDIKRELIVLHQSNERLQDSLHYLTTLVG